MDNPEKVVLVTGANRGIGKELSRQLAEKGYTVLMTARTLEKGTQAAQELGGNSLHPLQLDVTDVASIAAAQAEVSSRFGRLDVLVNNAAINYDTHQQAVSVDLDNVRQTLETNLFGVWETCQQFLPLLRRSAHARIVNVSSQSGSLEGMGGGTPAYSLSKAGLNALTRLLAAELRGAGILVNAICPGWVATDMGGSGGGPVPEGARSVLWGVELPDDGPTGGFFRHGQPLPW